jgi:hypothetical protein
MEEAAAASKTLAWKKVAQKKHQLGPKFNVLEWNIG